MSKMYYVNGSTVRELGVPEPVRRERQGREEIERARREKNARLAVRRNREKAQGMSRGSTASRIRLLQHSSSLHVTTLSILSV